jgi:UDP-N-acetylenolpyruvoylglucosamine reductase
MSITEPGLPLSPAAAPAPSLLPPSLVPPVAAVEDLRSRVHGPVYVEGDEGLVAEAACWNLAVTHRPQVVVGATCAADVVAAVRFAARHGLQVSVQATGHGPLRPSSGTLLVSTRRMQGVAVDPSRRVARIQAGSKWAAVLTAAEEHGLTPLIGSSSDVGAVGYTLGGGMGVLGRAHGLAADSVVAVEVVTADGVLRRATPDTEPELFWAVRGSKNDLGIVTAMEVQLYPGDALVGGGVFFAAEDAAAVLHTYREWAPTLPEAVTTSIAVLRLPPLPELPEPLQGQTVVHLRFCSTGLTREEADALLAPMTTSGRVVLGFVGPILPTELDSVHMDPVDPMPAWEKGAQLAELTAGTVDALLAAAGPDVPVPLIMVEVRQLGGAVARTPERPSAAPGRDNPWQVLVIGPMVPELAEVVPLVGHGVLAALEPWTAPGCLLNFIGDVAGPAEVAAKYPAGAVDRLRAAKRAYDPAGLFLNAYSVGPA